ncbi:MAG TPA: hypothetical protein VH518_15135, partial [Tepidisphaeraceae bacterium]
MANVRSGGKLSNLAQACLSAAVLATLGVGCNAPSDEQFFDPRALQQTERTRAAEVGLQSKRPLPTTLESPFLQAGPGPAAPVRPTTAPTTGPALESDVILRMPLQEVVHRAVANNLDVKVAGYTPAIDETRVTEAEARFDPTFFQNVGYERRDRESNVFATNNGRFITSETGIKQLLPSGGDASLSYKIGWTEPNNKSSSPFSTANNSQFWENEVVLQVTQPLLRDFGNDINRARITINRNNQRVSLL